MTNINSILYGITSGLANRQQLAHICNRFREPLCTVAIKPEDLFESGVSVMALDFDGVLAPHGASEPLPEVVVWLRKCSNVLGEEKIYILSNKPDPQRAAYFKKFFPTVHFIAGVRKKPYPDGLKRIMEISGAAPQQVVLLDDRLLTGVLATCLAETSVIYITKPYVSLRTHPVAESFFLLLRAVERKFVSLLNLW